MKLDVAEEVLKPYLVTGPYENGDWDARCPLHDDHKRSMRVNFKKNVWKCFAECGQGALSGLVKRMRQEGNIKSKPLNRKPQSPSETKVGSVSLQDIERWHQALANDPYTLEYMLNIRGLTLLTIQMYKIGWDDRRGAFTIPIFYADGSLFNVRRYRPNEESDKKIWWATKNGAETILFPESVLEDTDTVVLCEGEMDALVANQNGFPAVTGTAGASSWRPKWSEKLRDKTVYIAYDRDAAGEEGARRVAQHLEPYARRIFNVKIPIKKKGADITDYFVGPTSGVPWGGPHDAGEFGKLLKRSKEHQKRSSNPLDMEPLPVTVQDSDDAQNNGRAMEMDVQVVSRRYPNYSVPKLIHSECTRDAGPRCAACPMMTTYAGKYSFEIEPGDEAILEIVEHATSKEHDVLRQKIGAVKCDRLRHDVRTRQSVERLYVRPSWEAEGEDSSTRAIYGVGIHNTPPSEIAHVVGTTYPDPDKRTNQFLAWSIDQAESAIDEFQVSSEMVRSLRQFQPEQDERSVDKIWKVAEDIEQHVTRIYGRRELHMAIMLVYHSLLSFPFQGKLEPRGWLDALVVGDTRTGKSEAANRMLGHYRLGKVVNCEAATLAGVVGGLQQVNSKEWMVSWGELPMNDRRLVILDEVNGLKPTEIQQMSDVRSSGFAQLTKIRSEQARARTRLLWLGNPRDAEMEDFTYGAQAIAPLIGNPEDVARFDFAMSLMSRDVKMKDVHQRPSLKQPTHDSEDSHNLVLWVWSRTPEDIEWAKGAERRVIQVAEELGSLYMRTPPLIQAANARFKIARIAAAISACTFSTDSSGRKVVITKEHVDGAAAFLHRVYSSPSFGYRVMSESRLHSREDLDVNMDEAKRFLMEEPGFYRFLRTTNGSFIPRDVELALNLDRPEASGRINRLIVLDMVESSKGNLKLTPDLRQIIREIEKEGLG